MAPWMAEGNRATGARDTEDSSVIVMLAAAGGGLALVCVLGGGLAAAGLRTGDRPGDAAVAAELIPGTRPAIIATVRNPGDVPLMAGLTVRRQLLPGWLDGGLTVRVPRRTARRKYLAGAQDTVGVVPARGQAGFRLAVPVTGPVAGPGAQRRYRLTAGVGQAGGRLRVISVPVVSGGPAQAGRPAPAARASDRD
jgi:hypothetical protein